MLIRNIKSTIKVIDFDRVEQKNVLSQFHSKPSVGKTKVMSLQQTMQFLFGIKVDVVPHKLTPDNAKQLLDKSTLVIDCLDNGAARKAVQSTVRALKLPCLHGALAADGAFGRVIWDEDFKIDDEAGVGQATCEGGEHLPFIAITASYIAKAAQEFLEGKKRVGYQVSPAGSKRI